MSDLPSGDLLREVTRVQHDKTLQAVCDLIESLPTTESRRGSYSSAARHAGDFRRDLLDGLKRLRDAVQ